MPHAHDRAHCTPNLNALSYRFAVCCDDESMGAHVNSVLAGLRDHSAEGEGGADHSAEGEGARAPHRYSLTASPGRDGALDLARDGELVEPGLGPADAVGWLVWDVNRLAAEQSGQHLLFHAGGLEADGTGVLVPGASGSGKSTLTAGLARAGLGYLSDELVALELDGAVPGRLLPYPKAITLKPGSFAVLAEMGPDPLGEGRGGEWQVPVGDGTGRRVGEPCAPGFVIAPRYDGAAETALTSLSETEAFFTLALHAVNLLSHGASGSAALGRLAADCECYALTFSDLDEACALVLGLVDARVEPGSRRRGTG
ncbi:MAG TPA: hypothetical protein VG346_09260 [Acidimicrobiales bacterium]|nr:hypothetical protein [Acidimicrobiales bacterium]